MSNYLLLGLLLLFFSIKQLPAQVESKKLSLVAAGGGYSRFWSLGAEKELLQKPHFAMAIRLGLGLQSESIYLPGRFQFYTLGENHRLQASLGATLLVERVKVTQTDTQLYLGAGLGYRYQASSWPLWFQLGYVQLLYTDPTAAQLVDPNPIWRPALEASVGIRLGNR